LDFRLYRGRRVNQFKLLRERLCGEVVSVAGHETSDRWLVLSSVSVVKWLASLAMKPRTAG